MPSGIEALDAESASREIDSTQTLVRYSRYVHATGWRDLLIEPVILSHLPRSQQNEDRTMLGSRLAEGKTR